MSSCSSEADVIRTRISACDDDNSVLYAYEPNAAYLHVIQDAVENLDKKFTAINGKVSKIYRFRAKLIWQNRKPLGYAYKHYTYLLSRKTKLQKTKKKDPPLPSSFSCSESYSPTSPVRRPTDDTQDNTVETYYHSQNSQFQDHESLIDDQELRLSQSPTIPEVYPPSYQPYYTPSDPVQSSCCVPCFTSPEAPRDTNDLSTVQASTSVPAAMLNQGRFSSPPNPEMTAYPTLMEDGTFSHTASSLYNPAGLGASSSVGSHPDMLKQNFSDDPLTWSVEEVILFLKQRDPQTVAPLADLFRQHDIDGKALLLLQSDVMIKYMGLKLGAALKLGYYIEKLKGEKHIDM